MHLRSISLKGFKSFPDRTRLDFAPGVSVIVTNLAAQKRNEEIVASGGSA